MEPVQAACSSYKEHLWRKSVCVHCNQPLSAHANSAAPTRSFQARLSPVIQSQPTQSPPRRVGLASPAASGAVVAKSPPPLLVPPKRPVAQNPSSAAVRSPVAGAQSAVEIANPKAEEVKSTVEQIAGSVARVVQEQIEQYLKKAIEAKDEEIAQLTSMLQLWSDDINSFTTYISSLEEENAQLRSQVNVERQRREEDVQKMAELAAEHLVPLERQLQRSEKRQTRLMEKVQNQREFLSCVVCFSKRRDTVLMPCNHLALCWECAEKVLQARSGCPICRQNIGHTVKVYQV